MRRRHLLLQDGVDFDLLAECRPQQLGDIENRAVDVDVARLQRLLAGERQQVLDQLGATIRRLIDQAGGLEEIRPVPKACDQHLGGAGDHRQHVVEIMRDAAGELADGIELLRLLKLALGFAPCGDVVIDQRRAADRAGGVAQRTARDHEVDRIAAARQASGDFRSVELFAAQHPHRGQFVQGQGVNRRPGAACPAPADRPPSCPGR